MKKISILFLALLAVFCGTWIMKMKSPVNRPNDAQAGTSSPWWENGDTPEADPEWVLDPEIPANYIPVPGAIEIYMVVDDDGNIIKYRERTQQEDGSWVWNDVNPDIPENYEPVPGLPNVYKVTNADGSVSYFKYIRNDDDTYAFVPVDSEGNPIEEKKEDTDPNAIPKNYVRIKDTNIYGVYNEHGVCIGYKERRFDAEKNEYYWVDAEKPVFEDKKPNSGNSSGNNKGDTTKPTETTPNQGGTKPKPTDPKPTNPDNGTTSPSNPTTNPGTNTTNPTVPNDDSGYTETETLTTQETKGGWVITYETIVTRVYDKNGELIKTSKVGPNEVSRRQLTEGDTNIPDPSKIASTLQAEYARVSVGMVFKDDMVQEVINIINTERVAAGMPAFVLNRTSDAGYISAIKACDMAIYNHSDPDSPMYGTASEICERFGVETKGATEVQWKTYNDTSEQIARRLYLLYGEELTTENHSEIGLTIVAKGAYYYVNLFLLER